MKKANKKAKKDAGEGGKRGKRGETTAYISASVTHTNYSRP